jgi:hypothetical protein
VGDLLVLWDVDYTLVNAFGLGTHMYELAFRELFGRDLSAVAPKAGRTDRAIGLHTLALAGIAEPRAHVDDFLAALARLDGQTAREFSMDEAARRARPWPAAPAADPEHLGDLDGRRARWVRLGGGSGSGVRQTRGCVRLRGGGCRGW